MTAERKLTPQAWPAAQVEIWQVKPVSLIERAIRNSSRKGDLVFDPFGGSGTTLIAAEKTGRHTSLIELNPKYVDVIVRRWQEFRGETAVLESSGQSFDDLNSG